MVKIIEIINEEFIAQNECLAVIFADSKEELSSEYSVSGLPTGRTLAPGCKFKTADGSEGYLKSDGTIEWVVEPSDLPSVDSSDNGKVLVVEDGQWAVGESPVTPEDIQQAVDNYCEANFSEWAGGLDSGLTQPLMAAPADKVGELKSALTDIVFDEQSATFSNISAYTTVAYKFYVGLVYDITISQGSARFGTRVTEDGNVVEWIAETAVSSTTIRFIPTIEANYLRILPNTTCTISIVAHGLVDMIGFTQTDLDGTKTRVSALESDFATVDPNSKSYTISDFTASTIYRLPEIGETISLTPSASSLNYTLCVPIKQGQVITLNARASSSKNTLGIADNDLVLRQRYNVGYRMDLSNGTLYAIKVVASCDGYALISVYPSTLSKLSISDVIRAKSSNSLRLPAWCPYPQKPADGSSDADFDSDNMTAQDIYDKLNNLAEKYPYFVTSEFLGNDATNTYPVYRYIIGKRNRLAWLSTNTPIRYKWTNGGTSVYTNHYSPRVGDHAYTASTGNTYSYDVSSVVNATKSIVVNGVTYARDGNTADDVVIVYSQNSKVGANIFNVTTTVGTISQVSGNNMTDSNGTTYVRYPLGDLSYNSDVTTIYIGANEHGPISDPRECAIVVTRLVEDLCNAHAKDNKFLNYMRSHFRIVLIPVANPYGFDNETRNNGNNVNINRNYDTIGWTEQEDADKGSYGGSEIETQYQIDSIMDSGARIALDLHCLGNTNAANDGKCHYGGIIHDFALFHEIYDNMLSAYNLTCTPYGSGDYTEDATGQAFFNQIGINGLLLEFQSREGVTGSGTLHSSGILEADYTFMLQILSMLMSDYGNVIGTDYLI